ncbi:MAG: TonB-dependent receptor [Ginsengibacter sp.]
MMKFLLIQKRILFFSIFLMISIGTQAQKGTVKGEVKDSRGMLPNASVIIEGKGAGTTTNNNGEYSLSIEPGKYSVSISYVGYQSYVTRITVKANETTTLNAELSVSGTDQEIVLVGSRAVGRSKLSSPVPVDVIPVSQVINDLGQVDLNQILNFIAPSFQSSKQTVADGTDHLDPAQLRGLGTDQVLVLINGKRQHQSALVNVNGTVNRGQVSTDLSVIPATSIERIEILRDGASAQYGSDAIAGVINIVLKKATGLLEASASYGAYITKYPKNYALYKMLGKTDNPDERITDGNTFQASLGYGFQLGKGYLALTGEYIDRQSTNRTGTYTGRTYPDVNGQNRDDSMMNAKGTTRNTFDLRAGNSAMKSGAVMYNFGMPVGKNGEFYAFGGYSKKKGNATGLYRYPSSVPGNAKIYASNVFALYPNGFLPEIVSDIQDFSTSVGFRTTVNDWHLDISNTYGINTFGFGVSNSVNYSQFAVAGNKQTSFDAGALKFFQNTVNADISKKYSVMEGLNVAGGLEYRIDGFGIRSGEEASYKNFNVPAAASAGAQVFPGFNSTLGGNKTRNDKAAYLDFELDVSKAFMVELAGRFENYSDFGSTFNYKLATRYKFTDNFQLRGSMSSGFRAPSMQQRFYEKTNTLFVSQGGSLVPIEAGTFTNDSKLAELLGIPKLKQETSQSYSVGLAAKPFTGFEVTIDAYNINIKNRIILTNNFVGGAAFPAIDAILKTAGANSANFFTNAVDTRATGLEAVFSYNMKLGAKQSITTSLATTFIKNTVKKDANGKPIIHASDILVNGGQLKNYFNREDQSRFEDANPKSKISFAVNYKYNKFGAMLRFVRFGKVVYKDGGNAADPFAENKVMNTFTGKVESTDQTFSAKLVTDLSLSYKVTTQLTAVVGANNLFDVYPDIQAHSSNQSLGRFIYSRRVEQQGYNGAYFFARLKLAINTKK